jgi:hypothetical protein
MVFIVGARRSGTNWLFQLLTLHPDVLGIEAETYLFALGIAPLAERIHHGSPASHQTGAVYMERESFQRALRAFTDEIYGGLASRLNPAAGRIVDRSPGHATHLDLIGTVYPDSWTIHIIRDGRDVARSLLEQPWGPESMTEAATDWATAIRQARAQAPPRYREVRHEDLMRDPVGGLVELFEWLQLPVDDALVNKIAQQADVPVNASRPAVGIEPRQWQTKLSASDLSDFDAAAGDLLRELGYPASPMQRATRRATLATAGGRLRATARPTRRRESSETTQAPPRYWNAAAAGDRIIELVDSPQPDAITDMLAPDAAVTLITDGATRTARGSAAADLLSGELRASAPLRHQQVRADVHVYDNGLTFVFTHRDADGTRTDSVMVTKLRRRVAEPQIVNLTYYRFSSTSDR